MNVAHIIACLNDGGAEAVLYRLCLADKLNSHVVISLRDEGKYGPLMREAGIDVQCLEMPRGFVTPRGIWKLYCLLKQIRPDVVQTWMYHADIIGGLVARSAGIKRVFWGLHNTNIILGKTKPATIFIAYLNAILSYMIPLMILSCSNRGIKVHQKMGYASGKFQVIPNGYDLSQFTPDLRAGGALKSTLAVPNGVPMLGMVARFDQQKDHHNFIAALGLLKQKNQDFRCLLVGTGLNEDNSEILGWLDALHVRDQVYLLGQRNDIPTIMNALDICVLSSSYGEAFPNVLCEAMACGTPCVTTDVGDAALIVGDTGWVATAGSPEQLAQAISDAIERMLADPDGWKQRQADVRQRILNRFSIERMVIRYHQLWHGDTPGIRVGDEGFTR